MIELKKHIISHETTVKEAVKLLEQIPENLTLFVVDDDNKLIGTLTDGDVRRGIINNFELESSVTKVMNKGFKAINENLILPCLVKQLRKSGIKIVPVLNGSGHITKFYNLQKTKTILPCDVVIMAGGKGERLRPLTNSIPKPLLPLGSKPIIEHNIDRLIHFGIKNIYISVNYLADQLIAYFKDGSEKGVNIRFIREDKFLGTIGAVRQVKDFENDHVFIMNSDLFTDIDFEDLWLNFVEKNADMAIASIPYTVNIPYAILTKSEDRIIGLKEKPKNTHYANAGIYLIKRSMIDLIPKRKFFNATDLIEKIIENGGVVIDNPITGYWIDIGRHEDYLKAQEIVKHLDY